MATAVYCTREQVKAALDVAETARSDEQVDRAIATGAANVEGLLKRRFRPTLATRYFDWPDRRHGRPWRLWLDANEVISVTTLVAGGTTIAASDYFLRNLDGDDRPPYTHIEIDLASSAAFQAGSTHQQAIAITGLYGHSNDEEQVGTLTSTLAADLTDTADAIWTTARIGVGDVLRIDSERMIVVGRTFVDSGQNLAGALTASSADDDVLVANGSAFAVGDTLRVDSERMLVVDRNTATNILYVKRAWDGTVLAAHSSGADVYTLSGVDLDRAQLGTTLAAHTTSSPAIYRHLVPALVRDLNIAEAINQLQQETSAYAREVGEGETSREASGRALRDLRARALDAYGRRARARAV